MKLNKSQYGWLKRIEATPDGQLLLTGKAYMQERCRSTMTALGYIKWSVLPSAMTGWGGITYIITAKGREAIRLREETSAVRLARIDRKARLKAAQQVSCLDDAMRAWAVSKPRQRIR